MQAYELQQCIFSHHFWHQYLYQDIWLQATETNFSKKKIHKIEQRAEESSLESAETKYIQDILRQEELKSLIHVPLMEYISKIIFIFFCPYGTLLRIQNLSRERAHVFLPWHSWNGEKKNLFLKSFISDFTGEEWEA